VTTVTATSLSPGSLRPAARRWGAPAAAGPAGRVALVPVRVARTGRTRPV